MSNWKKDAQALADIPGNFRGLHCGDLAAVRLRHDRPDRGMARIEHADVPGAAVFRRHQAGDARSVATVGSFSFRAGFRTWPGLIRLLARDADACTGTEGLCCERTGL